MKESVNQDKKETKPESHQPAKAELEVEINISTTPDALLEAVFGYDPRKS